MSLMPQTPFQWLVSATTGDGQVPAAEYLVKFYEAGTATPKVIYTDFLLEVPYPSPSNTAELDADGRALIYLGSGGYKMVVCEPDGTPVYTQDNIQGEGAFGTGFVDSFAELQDVNTALNRYTYIGGYYSPGDGGQGMFYNETSATATDGGYVQSSNFDPTKRWFRIPDENGDVRAASFGYTPRLAGNLTTQLLAADSYAFINSARLRIYNGLSATLSTLTLTAPTVVFDETAGFLGASGTVNITVNGIIEAGGWQVFYNFDAVTLANVKQETRPEWFGASTVASGAANATAFAAMVAAGGGVFVIPAGVWPHTGTFTPSATAITLFFGSVGSWLPGTYYAPASLISGNLSLTLTGAFALTGNVVLNGDAAINGDASVSGPLTVDDTVTAVAVASVTNVSAGTSISAGTLISAGGTISAGDTPSLAGHIQARAGTSVAQVFKVAGRAQTVIGTGDATLAANSMDTDGQYIRIYIAGTTTTQNPTIAVTVGGATVFTSNAMNSPASGTFDVVVTVTVIRNGASGSVSFGSCHFNAVASVSGSGTSNTGTDTAAASITWANANTIAASGFTKTATTYEIWP